MCVKRLSQDIALSIQLDPLFGHRQLEQPVLIGHTQLSHHVLAMRLNRPPANHQLAGDLLVGQGTQNTGKYRPLSVCEAREQVIRRPIFFG